MRRQRNSAPYVTDKGSLEPLTYDYVVLFKLFRKDSRFKWTKKRGAAQPELMRFVDSGLPEVLGEEPEKASIRFHIPSKAIHWHQREDAAYSVNCIRPDKNAELCWGRETGREKGHH
jgi:hypothetical protein